MSLLSKIDEIIEDDFKYELGVPLSEDHVDAHCREVKYKYENGNVLILRFQTPIAEGELDPFTIFKDGKWRRICDYIILYESQGKLHVFLCELKSESSNGYQTQLWGGYCILNYILRSASRFLDREVSQDEIIIKMILISSNAQKMYKNFKPEELSFPSNNRIKINLFKHYCNSELLLDSYVSR